MTNNNMVFSKFSQLLNDYEFENIPFNIRFSMFSKYDRYVNCYVIPNIKKIFNEVYAEKLINDIIYILFLEVKRYVYLSFESKHDVYKINAGMDRFLRDVTKDYLIQKLIKDENNNTDNKQLLLTMNEIYYVSDCYANDKFKNKIKAKEICEVLNITKFELLKLYISSGLYNYNKIIELSNDNNYKENEKIRK